MPDTYLSTLEVADYLGVTPGRIRQFVRDHRLTCAKKIGAALLFDPAEVHKFAEIERKVGRPKISENDR